jgi:TonB family protein
MWSLNAQVRDSEAIPIKVVQPTYSDEAMRWRYKADVLLTVSVDERGSPQGVRVYMPAGLGLDERAVTALRLWRFRPAMSHGKRISTEVVVEVSFRPGKKTTSRVLATADIPPIYGDR